MGLIEALQNFSDNLPHAIDGLKDLREDFKKTFAPLAREGAELFTVGFQQMVVQDNGDWKSSFEHLDEARRLFAAARLSEAGLPAARAAAEEGAAMAIGRLSDELRECRDAMLDLHELLEIDRPDEEELADDEARLLRYGRPRMGGFFGAMARLTDRMGCIGAGVEVGEISRKIAALAYGKVLAQGGIVGPMVIDCTLSASFTCAEMEEVNARSRREWEAVKAFADDAGQIGALARWEVEQWGKVAEAAKQVSADVIASRRQLTTWASAVEKALNADATLDPCAPAERARLVHALTLVREFLATAPFDPATLEINHLCTEKLRLLRDGGGRLTASVTPLR